MALPSKYSLGVPMSDFYFTNPVAAQQAAASLQARLGFERDTSKAFQDYINRTQENAGANTRQVVGTLGQLGVADIGAKSAGNVAGIQAAGMKDLRGWESGERQKDRDAGLTQMEKAEAIRLREAARQKYAKDLAYWNAAQQELRLAQGNPNFKTGKYIAKDASGNWVSLFPEPMDPDAVSSGPVGVGGQRRGSAWGGVTEGSIPERGRPPGWGIPPDLTPGPPVGVPSGDSNRPEADWSRPRLRLTPKSTDAGRPQSDWFAKPQLKLVAVPDSEYYSREPIYAPERDVNEFVPQASWPDY